MREIMIKKAYVTETADGFINLKIKRECACNNKETCDKMCFSFAESYIEIKLPAPLSGDIRAGDIVELGYDAVKILLYSFFIFIMPLAAATGAFLLMRSIVPDGMIIYILSFAAFILSFVIIGLIFNKIIEKNNNYKIIRKI